MKSPGRTSPRSGCCQRTSASALRDLLAADMNLGLILQEQFVVVDRLVEVARELAARSRSTAARSRRASTVMRRSRASRERVLGLLDRAGPHRACAAGGGSTATVRRDRVTAHRRGRTACSNAFSIAAMRDRSAAPRPSRSRSRPICVRPRTATLAVGSTAAIRRRRASAQQVGAERSRDGAAGRRNWRSRRAAGTAMPEPVSACPRAWRGSQHLHGLP